MQRATRRMAAKWRNCVNGLPIQSTSANNKFMKHDPDTEHSALEPWHHAALPSSASKRTAPSEKKTCGRRNFQSAKTRNGEQLLLPDCRKRLARMRDWRNTIGNLIESVWLNKDYHGPRFTGICAKHRGAVSLNL